MTLTPNEVEIHSKIMRPLRSKPYISIAVPSSLTTDGKTLREHTIKVGLIGRAATIFRVELIAVYNDGEGDAEIIQNILTYLEVPPYLKKLLVPLSPELRFVGIVPPLKAPHHVQPDIFNTRYREGFILDREKDRCIIDIGLSKKGIAYGFCPKKGTRVTVKIVREEQKYYHVDIVDRSTIDIYWGYVVQYFNSLKELLDYADKYNSLVIIASKKGKPIYEVENNIIKEFKARDYMLIIFGGPYLDVDEIAQKEGIAIEEFADCIVNFIPRQGTVNIRTEEAVIATLSIINYLKEKTYTKYM